MHRPAHGDGNQLCQWTGRTSPPRPSTSLTAEPDRADPQPRLLGHVEGPASHAANGDAFSTRCYTTVNCTARRRTSSTGTPTDTDRGYWYVVKIPAGRDPGTRRHQRVRRRPYNHGTAPPGLHLGLARPASDAPARRLRDRVPGVQADQPARLQRPHQRVHERPPATRADGSCWWGLDKEPPSAAAGARSARSPAVPPGDTYLVNVRSNTAAPPATGVNGYALEAVTSGSYTDPVQPALYAYANMGDVQQQHLLATRHAATATFYLAEVGPQYAGKTLVVELWDAGDELRRRTSTMYPMKPSHDGAQARPSTCRPPTAATRPIPAPNTVQTPRPARSTRARRYSSDRTPRTRRRQLRHRDATGGSAPVQRRLAADPDRHPRRPTPATLGASTPRPSQLVLVGHPLPVRGGNARRHHLAGPHRGQPGPPHRVAGSGLGPRGAR